MKTLFSTLILVLLAAVTGLEATRGKHAGADGVPVLVWATDDNPVRQEQMDLFRHWYAEKYHEPIDIRVDPTNEDRAKIVVQSVAGAGPDLFDYFGPTSLQAYVTSGVILDVTESARIGGFSAERFWPALGSTIAFDGRQYAVPDNTCGSMILAHADVFAAAGLPLPKAGWTWEDLRKLAKALTVVGAGGQVERFGLLRLSWQALVRQGGGRWFDADGARCAVDSPETVAAFTFYLDMTDRDHVMPSYFDMLNMASKGGYGSGSINLFAAKRAAMTEMGRYAYINFNQINAERVNAGEPPLRIVPLPPVTGRRPCVTASGRCTGVNRRSLHRSEAIRFLEFLASETFNDQINRSADGLSNVIEYSTGSKGITGGRDFIPGCDDPLWVSTMDGADSFPTSRFISGTVLDRIMEEEFSRLVNHLQSPAATATRMRSLIETAMARYVADHADLQREWHQLRQDQVRQDELGR